MSDRRPRGPASPGDTPRAPPTSMRDTSSDLPPVLGDAPKSLRHRGIPVDTLRLDQTEEMPAARHRAETVRTLVAAAPLPADRATLTVVHGVNAGEVFALEGDVAVLGREHDAEFFVDDPAISRHHCRFRRSDDRYFVEDLGSANGTFLGGRRLRELQLGELFTGDRVQVGPNVVLRFSLSDRLEEQMQRRLYESATRDALTQAWSRSYLLERLAIEVASARRHRHALALLMIEIDRFQDLAGATGPTNAGRLLQAISARMMRGLRVEDVLGRWSGERFAIVVRATDVDGATIQAERLRASVSELSVTSKDGPLKTTISVGVASLAELDPRQSDKDLVALAESRLDDAKRAGGNRTVARSTQRRR